MANTDFIFVDEEFWTKEQKMKIWKNFQQCLKARSLEKMHDLMYRYLHVRAGFIAHYNIHGFREYYSRDNFIEFLEHFAKPIWYWKTNDLDDAMIQIVKSEYPKIKQEFEIRRQNQEIERLRGLAEKLGYQIVEKARSDDPITVFLQTSPEDGQMYLLL